MLLYHLKRRTDSPSARVLSISGNTPGIDIVMVWDCVLSTNGVMLFRQHPQMGCGTRQLCPPETTYPAIALRDDDTVMPFGTSGGDAQVQSMLQVFLNIIHFWNVCARCNRRTAYNFSLLDPTAL